MFTQFFNPNNSGAPAAGFKLYTYAAGTTMKQATWTDSTQSVQNANPLVLDSSGGGYVWGDPTIPYKFVWSLANDTDPPASPIRTVDNLYFPFSIASLTQAFIGFILYPQTLAELVAGVTPTNYVYPPGNVLRYGADPTGVADSSVAFASAFLVKGVISAQGAFKINSGQTMDISTTSLIGPCSMTSGLLASAGAVIKVVASGSVNANAIHEIRGVEFLGGNLTGVQALDLNTPSNAVDCCSISQCTFSNFADGIKVTQSAFEVNIRACIFNGCGSDHAGLYVLFIGSERMSCIQCAFFNSTECVRNNSGGEIFLDNCSLDYSNRILNAPFGNIYATNCYFENGSNVGDLDYWFKTGANGSIISLVNCQISQTAAKNTFAYGQSLSTYGGSLNFRFCKIYTTTNSIVDPIIAGTGNAYATGTQIDGFGNSQLAWSGFSLQQNFCSNGTFANGAGGLGGWVVGASGGTNPTASANTLLLQPSIGGNSQFAYWTITAEPGQNVGFQCMAKGNTSACSFSMVIRAIGADTTTIATTTEVPGFNGFNGSTVPMPTAYTALRASFLNLPAGTASVQLELNTAGATSSSNLVSVQTVVVGKY